MKIKLYMCGDNMITMNSTNNLIGDVSISNDGLTVIGGNGGFYVESDKPIRVPYFEASITVHRSGSHYIGFINGDLPIIHPNTQNGGTYLRSNSQAAIFIWDTSNDKFNMSKYSNNYFSSFIDTRGLGSYVGLISFFLLDNYIYYAVNGQIKLKYNTGLNFDLKNLYVFETNQWSTVHSTIVYNFGGESGKDFKYLDLYRMVLRYNNLYNNDENIYGIRK